MNAKAEYLEHIKGKDVLCASLRFEEWDDITRLFELKQNHTEQELETFLGMLDFEYDNGYGRQQLFGYIWYKDGTWSQRGKYIVSEWWEHMQVPEIPEELKQ